MPRGAPIDNLSLRLIVLFASRLLNDGTISIITKQERAITKEMHYYIMIKKINNLLTFVETT